nr:MAG TPA: hypothetical protein [Bacteriophage sp.]
MDILCYINMILYCVWGCDLVCCCASRLFYYVQMILLCYIHVVLNTIYYE